MTNDVEKLILLNNNKDSNINYEQNITYLFYKEIWKFLLFVNKYNYNKLNIKIRIDKKDNKYFISKNMGIKYELIGNELKYCFNTYYDGCDEISINNVLDTNIDIRLLYKLLYLDGFDYDYLFDDDNFDLYINIDKYSVDRVIESMLLKNKVLKKEM